MCDLEHSTSALKTLSLTGDNGSGTLSLISLPRDILVLLPNYLHNVEDYMNLASTCTVFRDYMATATPNTVLTLAAAQTKVFFRPSPHYLVVAVARELGDWARESDSNESLFAESCKGGIDGLLTLALRHCGLTMARIRELHGLRFSVINPVTDTIDKCVGEQWYATDDFWCGGVSNPATIHSEPSESLFHLAMYGELFAPDLESYLDQDPARRRLRVDTRFEFVKYCVPDFSTIGGLVPKPSADPRSLAEYTGPYRVDETGGGSRFVETPLDHNMALAWCLGSSKWRSHWREARRLAGTEEFKDGYEFVWDDNWWLQQDLYSWRQNLWENVMCCQGLEGLGMTQPGLREGWFPRIREWRRKIGKLKKDDRVVCIRGEITYEYPYLLGDLEIMR